MLRAFLPVGYRNLEGGVPSTKFGRINLLVGPNNSGKSNYIKAMGFPRDLLLSEGGPTKFLHTVEKHGRAEVMNRAHWARKQKGRLITQQDILLWWIIDSPPLRQTGDGRRTSAPASTTASLLYSVGYQVGDSASFPSGFFLNNEVVARYEEPVLGPLDSPSSFAVHTELAADGGQAVFDIEMLGAEVGTTERQTVKVPISMNETFFGQKDALLKDRRFYAQVFPAFRQVEEDLLTFARGFRTYSSTDLDVRQMAEGAKIDLSVRALDAEGSEFVNVLRYLDQKYDFLDEYAERLRELMPDLKRLKVIDASDTYKQLELHIGGHKYKPREMSDGTLKALWLALLLFSPERGSVLSIDEPEMNFHPAWLKVIGRWLQRFTSAEQLFVSTHSPDLLDTFTEGFKSGEVALFVFGLGDKEMRLVEPAALESFFKDGWELGDLYRVGEPQLGGWPW